MRSELPPILCLGFPAWEGDYQKSTVQLMRALAATQRVLYVEYPFSWKDVWQGWRGAAKPYRRVLGLEARLRAMPVAGTGSLHVLTLPPVLPINGLSPGGLYEALAKANARRVLPAIRQALRQLGYARPLLINAFNPFLGVYLHGQLDVTATYYYCYDQIGAARWTHRHGPRLEARLLRQIDGLVATSQPLLDAKDAPQATLVPNGVDLALFEQAFAELPDRSGPPVLGYLGSIDDRVDTGLLLRLLACWPEARLLMVGRITHPEIAARLEAHPRIELAGARQPAELPAWVRQMHIGLIPFVDNAFTRYIYPLKINEYLAAGLPVVCTPFGDLGDFRGIAHVAAGDAFVDACRQVWLDDSPARRIARRDFARTHSWEARAAQLLTWLADPTREKSRVSQPILS